MCIVAGVVASASDMAVCRTRLTGNFEGGSTLEHESKCAMVQGIVASLSPMKDNLSGSVRYFDGHATYEWEDVLQGSRFCLCSQHGVQCGSERCLSSEMAK